VKRYRVRINRAGAIFIGITVFFGIAAVNTANNLLYIVVSSLLSFMLLSGVFSLYNLRGLNVVFIPPAEVYARREATFRVLLKKDSRVPSFLITVSYGESSCFFPLVYEPSEERISLSMPRRGFYNSLPIVISSSFPIGLFERYYTLEIPLNLTVFPEPLDVSEAELINLQQERGRSSHAGKIKGYDELHGVREYRNEPIKLVHWKTSAKTGKLYVKEMYEETSKPVILELESVSGSIEERISKLTYLVIRFTEEGIPVGLKIGEELIEPATGVAHRRKLLSRLALL